LKRVRPDGAAHQWGRVPPRQLSVRSGSYRAAWSGNRPGRSLVTKSTEGGRATLRAVTRVKLEQASKVTSWTPTRPFSGEGRARRGRNRRMHSPWSTGVVSTARREGELGNRGRPGRGGGRGPNVTSGGGRTGRRRGS
jgi:hypothetical protein